MKRILIIEDDIIIAKDLKGILQESGYVVCGILDGSSNIDIDLEKLKPDIIISDIYLRNGTNAIKLLYPYQTKQAYPLIFISSYCNIELIDELSRIKHDGYIVKPFTDAQVLASVNLVCKKILNQNIKLDELSFTEREISMFIVNGMTTREIAHATNRSEHTIITHRKNIFRKLNIHNVQQLIKILSR